MSSEGGGGEGGGGEGVVDKDKINPLLITRRSQRVIKPTKDIDLYLLSVKFGVSLEDSEGEESSDMEFAPAEESDGRPKKMVWSCPYLVIVGSLSPAGSLSDMSSISGEREEGKEGEEKKEDRQTGTGMRRSLDQMLYCIMTT